MARQAPRREPSRHPERAKAASATLTAALAAESGYVGRRMLPAASLFCGESLVARLSEVFRSDGTWYANYRLAVGGGDPGARRAVEFIEFCQAWHERLRNDSEPPSASEFDRFADIAGIWHVAMADGRLLGVADHPVFVESELSWVE